MGAEEVRGKMAKEITQVATLKDKAKETVQVVTYNRHHYL